MKFESLSLEKFKSFTMSAKEIFGGGGGSMEYYWTAANSGGCDFVQDSREWDCCDEY